MDHFVVAGIIVGGLAFIVGACLLGRWYWFKCKRRNLACTRDNRRNYRKAKRFVLGASVQTQDIQCGTKNKRIQA